MIAIEFTDRAAEDYLDLDRSVRLEVQKVFEKCQVDPRGYGDVLGKKAGIDLFGFYSQYAGRRVRVIYQVVIDDGLERVIVWAVGKRDRFLAHRSAQERIDAIAEAAKEQLRELQDVLEAAGDT